MYPKSLEEYLKENVDEGREVIACISEDAYTWIIPNDIGDGWYVICQWHEGQDDYTVVNITGGALEVMKRLISSVNTD